jgi:formylglycine-generating enzyme required for sulfatase activity
MTMSRTWLLSVFLVLFPATVLPSALGQAKGGKKYALLIGINQYKHESLRPLSCSEADVKDLGDLLREAGYEVTVLTGTSATRAAIQQHVTKVRSGRDSDDTLVIAFSGHGMQFEKEEEADEEDAYYCPWDACPFRDERQSLVSLKWVYLEMKKSFATRKVLLVDACRNDPDSSKSRGSKGSKGGVTSDILAPPERLAVLFSCGPGQKAWENEKLGHSVFFHHVLEGLKGKAARSRDGAVTLGALADYVMAEVPETVKQLVSGKIQSPNYKSDLSGEVLLLHKKAADKPPAERPVITRTEPARAFRNTLGMDLVLLPGGDFTMGSPSHEQGREPDEMQHRVSLTRPFYMGRYPVTRGQFEAFVNATRHLTDAEKSRVGGMGYTGEGGFPFDLSPRFSWRNPGVKQTATHPVVNVSWNDAKAFCAWLSQKENRTYRLPTEAEWEYACRAGTQTPFWSGFADASLKNVANVADQALKRIASEVPVHPWDDGYAFPAPARAGTFRSNPFGLYHMHGNVWQWCEDWYAEYGFQNDPQGPENGEKRVVRGGSCFNEAGMCRSAKREKHLPNDRLNDLGFRVVAVDTEASGGTAAPSVPR